jgi:hypothetical protein
MFFINHGNYSEKQRCHSLLSFTISLINSLKSSPECPFCRKETWDYDISHIYLSSTDSGTSTSELLALLQEARLREKEKHGALEESRKVNTFLQEELQRSMALATTNKFLRYENWNNAAQE